MWFRDRFTARRWQKGALLSSFLVLLAFAAGQALPASASKTATSPLKKGLAYYRGKTITFIVASTAGSNFDIETRQMVPFMESYLDATINVADISAGAGIAGQDTLAASVPNGLTIGWLSTGTDLSNLIYDNPGLNFNPAREVMLGATEKSSELLIASAVSPFTSLAALQSASATTSARLLLQNSASSNIQVLLLLRAFGVHATYVYGYSSSTAIITGLLRGDGNLSYQGIAQGTPLVQAHEVYALLQTVPISKTSGVYSSFKNVPTVAEAVKKYGQDTAGAKKALQLFDEWLDNPTQAFAAPSRTPSDEVVALRSAIAYAMKQPALKQEFINEGNPVGDVNPTKVKAGYANGLKLVSKIKSLLGI